MQAECSSDTVTLHSVTTEKVTVGFSRNLPVYVKRYLLLRLELIGYFWEICTFSENLSGFL
jgi:hypothetical protein